MRLETALPILFVLAGCADATLYDVSFVAQVDDPGGQPIERLSAALCMQLGFEDGETSDEGCDSGVTDADGVLTASAIEDSFATLSEATADLEVNGIRLEGELGERSSAPDPQLDVGELVTVPVRFTVPDEVLPVIPHTYTVYGTVLREGLPVADKTGTLTVDLSFDGGATVGLTGSAPVTTDDRGNYRVDVEINHYFAIQAGDAGITTSIDIDGYRSEGDLLDVERTDNDPVTYEVWSMF